MFNWIKSLFLRKPEAPAPRIPVQLFKIGAEVEIHGYCTSPDGWHGFITECQWLNGQWNYLVEGKIDGGTFMLGVPEKHLKAVSRG